MNDFDFLHGSWTVHNRTLVARGADEWREFPGTAVCHGFFDGAGSFDEFTFPTLGSSGATIRVFDPDKKEWSIYWVDSRFGVLGEPVFGTFSDGVGTFYGDEEFQGAPARIRYLWSEITPRSARWEQALSLDEERTWETNWIMSLTRTG
jgi:hypothetical protein